MKTILSLILIGSTFATSSVFAGACPPLVKLVAVEDKQSTLKDEQIVRASVNHLALDLLVKSARVSFIKGWDQSRRLGLGDMNEWSTSDSLKASLDYLLHLQNEEGLFSTLSSGEISAEENVKLATALLTVSRSFFKKKNGLLADRILEKMDLSEHAEKLAMENPSLYAMAWAMGLFKAGSVKKEIILGFIKDKGLSIDDGSLFDKSSTPFTAYALEALSTIQKSTVISTISKTLYWDPIVRARVRYLVNH